MIGFELLRDKGVLIVKPSGPLAAGDFRTLAATVSASLRSVTTAACVRGPGDGVAPAGNATTGRRTRVSSTPGWILASRRRTSRMSLGRCSIAGLIMSATS